MHSVQLLLPLYKSDGEPIPHSYFTDLKNTLTEKFGGLTTYTRSPATGFWKENRAKTVKDDIIIYEVMTENIDKMWWKSCRKNLELQFQQEQVLIRTWEIEVL